MSAIVRGYLRDIREEDDTSMEPGRRRTTGVEYTPIVVNDGAEASRHEPTVCFRAGDVLFGPGDYLDVAYRLLAGRVELVLEGPKGRELVLLSAGPGAVVGEDYVLTGAPSLVWAVAASDTVAATYNREALLRQVCADPTLAASVFTSLAKKLETTTIRLHNTTFMNLLCRVAKLLLAGAQDAGERGLVTYITHSEIARCTGSCRVAVTRTLKQLERAGLVSLHRGWVELKDSERLGRIACLSAD
ncbi:MAG: Crp/Fnr family transcriptional regulator [Firmicutes bacterium]|nr:Crp/Fnr family transcriptional regulator [Bacillota bacterium]